MDITQFINRVVNDGITAVKRDYTRPDQKDKRDGSIAGFEACRDKSLVELKDLLEATRTATEDARRNRVKNYWWYRCYEAEVEWVCNCVSAVLVNEGLPVLIIPTCRGAQKAASILGVR